jgi:biotin carboxylase
MNRALLKAMNFVRGATHAEFIKGDADGEFYFLEVAGRVGGAYIAETLEAATGVNIWREWANIELARDVAPYSLPAHVNDYAGVALALARQEWPDTAAFDDPEVVHRVQKRHHVGLIVRSPSYARVQQLLSDYVGRINDHHLAVLPPLERAE